MTRAVTGTLLWFLLLLHAPPSSANETGSWVNVAENTVLAGTDIRAIGQVRFPDGLSALWISTPSAIWRKTGGNWQRWPENEDITGEVRDILLAPDASGITHWWLATGDGLLKSPDGQEWQRLNAANSPLTDDDIQALHLTQGHDGNAVIWIGTGQGLMQLQNDEWRVIAARSDGFHGGQIDRLLGIEADAGHQVWAAGREGLSVHANGQWQRPDRTCLHRQRAYDIRHLTHPMGNRIGVATDRGLLLIDPANLEDCRLLDSPHAADQPVTALSGNMDHGIILLRPGGIERLQFGRSLEVSRWAWSDQHDGLPASAQWVSGQPTIGLDEAPVASRQGLWAWKGRPAERNDIELALSIEETGEVIADGEAIRVRDSAVRFSAQVRGMARPHAALYRHSVDSGENWTAWQRTPVFEVPLPEFGRNTVQVEMVDDLGERRGPWQFHLERTFPIGTISAIVLVTLTLIMIALIIQVRRKN